MSVLPDWIFLAAGIALLVGGGESTVRGAAALARQLGVSPLVIGLTVVAFGTSAPEFAVNVTAAIRGDGDVAFGNVIGSNLANVGLILAGCAVVQGLTIHSVVVSREIPMMLVASAAGLVMGVDALRGDAISRFDRAEGLLFLLLFGIFLYYTIAETLRKRASDPLLQQAREHEVGTRLESYASSGGLLAVGLVALALGGQMTVRGAAGVAEALGASESLIGLTIIAVGTSLPELSASAMAARKGEMDLAVGNVIGSNIFNLLFIMGVTAVIFPVPIPDGGFADLVAMVAFGGVLFLLALWRARITRHEGVALLGAYFAYIGWRVL